MKSEHPCDICTNLNCDGFEAECVWGIAYSKKNECCTYDCMMNREGSCLGGFYDQCGAQTDTCEEENEK